MTFVQNRPTWLHVWTPSDVQNAADPAKAFADYCQQTMGVPWPTIGDLKILRKKANEFFEHYPQADWTTLCRVAQWCRSRKRRCSRVWLVVDEFRNAWAKGGLPELDPRDNADERVEEGIERALEAEERPEWRRRLIAARGVDARREAYQEWLASSSSSQ